jgi:predicted nucleotidyltransferase
MKVVGLVVEYNPFHNGHLYHLEEAKRITNADYVIAIMSGDFLQRGAPALMDKYLRTQMAIQNGVDLVIELPVCYSTASAEFFARSSIEILNKLGVVDYLCFGSECGDIEILNEIANLLINPNETFDETLRSELKKGLSYPLARSNAIIEYYRHNNPNIEIEEITKSPNNILAIEYLKALLSSKSNITPYTIKRVETGYHDISINSSIISATAIRNQLIDTQNILKLNNKVPNSTYNLMYDNINKVFPIFTDDFSTVLKFKLLSIQQDSYIEYLDVSSDIHYRLQAEKYPSSFSDLANTIKAKHLTLTRIQRALTHILLDVTNNDMEKYILNGWVGYARILGFSLTCTKLFTKIKSNGSIPLVTKISKSLLELDPIWSNMLSNTINASKVYNLIAWNKFGTVLPDDYSRKIIKL